MSILRYHYLDQTIIFRSIKICKMFLFYCHFFSKSSWLFEVFSLFFFFFFPQTLKRSDSIHITRWIGKTCSRFLTRNESVPHILDYSSEVKAVNVPQIKQGILLATINKRSKQILWMYEALAYLLWYKVHCVTFLLNELT